VRQHGASREEGWDVERPVLCFSDEGWTATILAPLSAGSRSTALHLLSSRYGAPTNPCPDGTQFDDVSVIAGDTWVVVVSRDDGADRVMERLGGELQPADGPGRRSATSPCPALPVSTNLREQGSAGRDGPHGHRNGPALPTWKVIVTAPSP
jgi:hypothetical protein